MNTVRAVLFDLDETLFDHSHCVAQAVGQLRRDHAGLQSRPLDEILAEHRRLLEIMHLEVLAGRLHPDQARIDRMRGLFSYCGAGISGELAMESAALHRERYRAAQRAVPGAHELLAELRRHGVKIGIVTNNLLDEQKGKLAVCNLDSHIDALVTSEQYGCTKPDPELFRIALRRLGCEAGDAVMVGDSWEVDILGAQNAGIRPVWFNRFELAPPDDSTEQLKALEPAAAAARVILKI